MRQVHAQRRRQPPHEQRPQEQCLPNQHVVQHRLPPFGLEELHAQAGGGGVRVAPDALCLSVDGEAKEGQLSCTCG